MSDHQSSYIRQQQIIAALRDPRSYPHAVQSVTVIETHISWVLLAGDFAYKIKKALNLGFLDYTALDARRFCCAEEIRLNRRMAPDLYLGTVTIGGSPDHPALEVLPALEYAVRMRRFDSANLMDRLLQHGRITPQHIDQLAGTLAGFHAGLSAAAAASGFGSPEAIEADALQNCEQLRALLRNPGDRRDLAALEAATAAEFFEYKAAFEMRRAQGFVRECHGDLHLGNIVLVDDVPVPFDGIEFNPGLRWIDVMDEIAFPVMDLLRHGYPELAWRLLNAWLEATGDYGGVAVLRFYLAYRAAVRAKVCAIRAGQADLARHAREEQWTVSRRYLSLARQCLAQYRPALIITHGLPGSGKTTFSQLVLQQMGAVRIRSDVERKRLYGLSSLQSSSPGIGNIYGADATQKTYARLLELARGILSSGFAVVVDAAFLKQAEREAFRQLARDMSVPFAIASLHADDGELHKRIRQRKDDASEADVSVLEMLREMQQPLLLHELARTARFTTAQKPGSKANLQAWKRLQQLLSGVAPRIRI